MSAATDRARFFLERSIPELQELERKKLFSKVSRNHSTLCRPQLINIQEEITSIAKARSDHEHRVNAPGCRAADYVRYAQWEMNLESLRRKRARKVGAKARDHAGLRRVSYVLDRGSRKFPGDLPLWMQYIEFTRQQKSRRTLTKILTAVLRLHPTKPNLWLYAADYYLQTEADFATARSLLQRGLRFCPQHKILWLEYARLEMGFLAKLSTRRQVLGLDHADKESLLIDAAERAAVPDPSRSGDPLVLPDVPEDHTDNSDDTPETKAAAALAKLQSSPAFAGAIPIAIFDNAMVHFRGDVDLAEQFFDVLLSFGVDKVLCGPANHVLEHLRLHHPDSPATVACEIKDTLQGVTTTSPAFAVALASVLQRINGLAPEVQMKVLRRCVLSLVRPLELDELDGDIRQALLSFLKGLLHTAAAESGSGDRVREDLRTLFKALDAQRLKKTTVVLKAAFSTLLEDDLKVQGQP